MSYSQKRKLTNSIIFIVLAIGAIAMIAPLIWMLSTSLKEKQDVFALPPVWIPEVFQFGKYKEIWEAGPVAQRDQKQSHCCGECNGGGHVYVQYRAFAFAKLRFPHKNKLFLALLASMMIPYPTVMIPQFIMFAKLGWVDTLLPLIVPGLFGNVIMIFFLRQYLLSVPDAIIEAAKIDGSSYFRLYSSITFPLIKPAIAAQLILWFMGIWNDYLAPIIYLNSPEKQTLQLVIANFNATYAIQTDYPLIMAASIVALLPVLIIFLIFQKQIIESVAISGVKG